MRVLFIAPVPPPINGQSLASGVLLEHLAQRHDVAVVNMAKERPKNAIGRLRRVLAVARLLRQVRAERSKADVIYLTISESVAGNLKDLAIYTICGRQLDKLVLHLHGGANMRHIMGDGSRILARLNRRFIRGMKGVIVLGPSLKGIFAAAIAPARLHAVPNFAEDYLFTDETSVPAKFVAAGPIRVLFLSNLLPGKGHLELLEAFVGLDDAMKQRVSIDFAGGFPSKTDEDAFRERLRPHANLAYHGIVKGAAKKSLFDNAQVFCLPTYYPFEGQPISILEAYASACVVVTTDHSGIQDVFEDGVNGYQVTPRSADAVRQALEEIIRRPERLPAIGAHNTRVAKRLYRTRAYTQSIQQILEA